MKIESMAMCCIVCLQGVDITFLRGIRVIRPLRLITSVQSLQVVMISLWKSVNTLAPCVTVQWGINRLCVLEVGHRCAAAGVASEPGRLRLRLQRQRKGSESATFDG